MTVPPEPKTPRTPTRRQVVTTSAVALAFVAGGITGGVINNQTQEEPKPPVEVETITGTLQVAIAMGESPVQARVIEHDGSITTLDVPSDQNLNTIQNQNQEVTITGVPIETTSSIADEPPVVVPTNIVPTTAGAVQPTAQAAKDIKIAYVLLHNPGSTVEPWTKTQVETQMLGPSAASVQNWIRTVSSNQSTVSSQVFGWWDPGNTSTCNLWNYQQSAATAATAHGVSLSSFNYIVVITPGASCAWAGIAYVGSGGVHLNGTISAAVTEHELGHNFGVWHSGAMYGTGLSDYGNVSSVMGSGSNSGVGGYAYSAYHKSIMGWLPAANQVQVTGTQDVTITGHEDPLASGIMLARAGNINVEKRAPVGLDATMPPSLLGIWVLNTTRQGTDDEFVPDLTTDDAKPIPVGSTFTLGTISVTNVDNSKVHIVTNATPPPTTVPPSTTPPTVTTTTRPPTTTTTTTIGPPPPPGSISQTSDDSNGPGGYASFKLGQTFTTTTTITVAQAQTKLLRTGNAGNATCNLFATSGGLPTTTRVARGSTTAPPTPLTTPQMVTCTFLDANGAAKPVALAANTMYALVINWSGGNGSNSLYWRTDASSPTYTGGTALRSRSSGAFDATSKISGSDNWFIIS